MKTTSLGHASWKYHTAFLCSQGLKLVVMIDFRFWYFLGRDMGIIKLVSTWKNHHSNLNQNNNPSYAKIGMFMGFLRYWYFLGKM